MQIILFTGDTAKKILSSEKSMTARYWRRKPPKAGTTVRAQTGRRKDTAFALLKVTGVYEWDGSMFGDTAEAATGLTPTEIGDREGFKDFYIKSPFEWRTSWDAFIDAYYSLNAHNFLDGEGRTHYFIAFELIEAL